MGPSDKPFAASELQARFPAVNRRAPAGDPGFLRRGFAGRKLRQEVSLVTYVALVYSTCAVLLWPAALVAGVRLTGFPAKTWGLFVLMALVPQMLGHTVFNYLLKDVSATVVVEEHHAVVKLDKRAHNPYLVASGLGKSPTPMPWFGGKSRVIEFS